MNDVKTFHQFISEAHLNASKSDIKYILSNKGKPYASKIDSNIEDVILTPTNILPDDTDEVLYLRPSSIVVKTGAEVKKLLPSKMFVFTTGDDSYPFAVAEIDKQTNMVVQSEKKGPSARGDYFREVCFMITLTKRLAERIKLEVNGLPSVPIYIDVRPGTYTNDKGQIEFYLGLNGEVRIKGTECDARYESKMSNQTLKDAMIKQCDALIDELGSSANKIVRIHKNISKMAILDFYDIALDTERKKIADKISPYEGIPNKITQHKWNPADIWLVFKDYEWMANPQSGDLVGSFEKLGITDLPSLNQFLNDSILSLKNEAENLATGIVGVSLKQQIQGAGRVFKINVDRTKKFSHKYAGFSAKTSIKTVKWFFNFISGQVITDPSEKREDRSKVKGKSGYIDIRTFDSDPKLGISMEIKGSEKSEHMGGKAGSYIEYVMKKHDGSSQYELMRKIKSGDMVDVRSFMKGYTWNTRNGEELKKVFYNDILLPKDQESNSRMQSIIFTDWFEGLENLPLQDKIITDIVRFAKAESDWSAPHLLVV